PKKNCFGPSSARRRAMCATRRCTRAAGGGKGVLVLSAVVAALGSLLFGFDTAVISGTTESLEQVFSLSKFLLGFTVSSALIGTMVGSLLAGRPADWWGRRPVLAVLAVLFLVSAAGCAFAWNWYALLFFRWLGGVAVGGASVVCPMYITEIAPARRRGILVAVSQLNIVLGILMAYFSNYLVARVIGADAVNTWRWMFGVMGLPAVAFLLTVLFIPESPRWLVKQGRRPEAEAVLARFGHEQPAREAGDIQESLTAEGGGASSGFAGLLGMALLAQIFALLVLFNSHPALVWIVGGVLLAGFGALVWKFPRKHLRLLVLALMIAAFNQLDGINAVIYYTADIFKMAGADKAGALMQSVIVGLTNLVMTVLAMLLIDRVGRKALLLVGSVTFVLSHALAAWVFYTHAQGWIVILAMMGVVGSHAYSQGAVVWVIINELLPNAVRASGSAIVCFLIWVLCACVSWSFPVVAAKSGSYAFGFFALMMVVQFFLVLKYLPETKGVSLEELQKRLEMKA
ncbi:MAG TPA: MFS transporter, partial [Verrucomicrobiae bacterium]